ncbi:MAG: sigma-70 family RNA polymerase sigma factor [Nannocystaceae bacterium]|nr:sigma-70 family RNA polymerase sigma factor [Nannocystaceae bacterium]
MSAQEPELERIIRDYSAMVQGALLRLGVPPPQLEDAAQEVFLVLSRRFGEFDAQRSLASWLWGIARGVASTQRRSVRRRERLAVAACAEPRREQHSAEDAVARSQAHGMLRVFLASLDEDKCAVFVLSEIEGCSGPEISARLHVNVNTVYARLRAARRRFDAAVEERRRRSQLVPAWIGFRWALPQVAKASLSTAMAAAIVLPSFEVVMQPNNAQMSERRTLDTSVTEVVAMTRSGLEPAKVEVEREISPMTMTLPALAVTAALGNDRQVGEKEHE